MPQTFDVVIPTLNNLPELKQCLEGFNDQSFKDFRVIVCVDGSTDGTIEFLGKAVFNFELLIRTHPGNINKGRDETRNLVLKHITAPFVLFIDSDILPSKDLLKNHFELLQKRDCISVGDVKFQDSDKNIWSFYLQTRGKGKYKHLQEMPSYYLNTQNVAFKSKYFIEIGGQDSDLSKSYGGDDTVLGHRIEKMFNVQTVFNKEASAFSKSEKSLSQALKQMKEFGEGNLKIIKRKYPGLNKIFRLNLMDSDAVHHKLFRLIFRESVSKVLLPVLKVSPVPVNLWIIQFLVFNAIYQGYKSG